ncbi:HYR domain-containing protein [Dawidia soli]|uniref:HYR domain-containing protein n=1 Tax=Dawidia soli TaxID=2782352 RepID=UPI0020B1E799|nr:HYR domain-containing protein [Dawidia soli]
MTWTPPTATDNCDASPQINSNTNPGATLSLGPHTITYTARDTKGNQSTCSFTVTVVDATRPVFSNCPANVSVPATAACTATATWTPPTANDNCGGPLSVTSTASPGATFGLGINTVTYEATDAAGNKETCSFTVTVTDNIKPVFTNCPASIAVSANPATCNTVVSWTPPTVTDNCDASPTTTTTNTPGSTFAPGIHTITYEATDAAGNKETCSFTVTVTDDTKPVFAGCPANIQVNTDPATCNAIVNWTPPTVTDNCDASPVITTTNTPGSTFTQGIHTVTYEATDAAGNKETCSFTVTVTDATKPAFTGCPAAINVTTDPATCNALVNWTPPTVTDNCDAAPVVTATNAPGSTFALGIHTVIYEATDASGNKETCSFTITVTDGTKPVFTSCPANISIPTNPAACDAVVNWTPPVATDNCDASPVVITTNAPGSTFTRGVHTVTYEATDAAGNKETCSFTVTVTDVTKPVFTNCPANISIPTHPATCEAVVSWTPPTVSDNCDGSPVVTTTQTPGSAFTIGVHTVTYEATDAAGNKETCSFTITVTDNTQPVFAGCPANIHVTTNPTSCDAVVTWVPPTVTDNCDAALLVTASNTPGSAFTPGVHTVTYEATDAAGNKETCSFTITVTDATKPVFSNCPANIAVNTNPLTCSAAVSWMPPTVTDNCDGSPAVTTTHLPGSTFTQGIHTVTYEATDAAGNKETCSFTITVTDATKPMFTDCPANINVTTSPTTCHAVVTWTAPTVTDNCDATPVVTTTSTPGSTFALGVHTVTYEATDAAGNKETCSFTVTVADAAKPVFTNCPANIQVATTAATCDATVSWTPPAVSDNCDASPVVTTTTTPGSTFTRGVHTVTYEATDAAGNKETCSFTITVTDGTKPVFANCPADISITTNPATCNAVVTWTPPSVTDNCDAAPVVTTTNIPGATFTLGIHTVTYEATDAAGNKETCSFTVTVTDDTKPVLTNCPTDIAVTTNATTCDAVVNWAPPTVTDNCDAAPVVTVSNTPGSAFTPGVHTVTYEATDASGNKESCSFTVTVTDGTKPVFTNCPADIHATTNAASCNAVVSWAPPIVTDNCDIAPIVTTTNAPGSTFTSGAHTVTYEATDAAGNKETCSFTVTVTDATKPVFANCPANINVATSPTTCDAIANWVPPTVTDNCDPSPVVTTTHLPGSTFTSGVHTVTYEAADAAGNKETCSFTVTVTDGTDPVFTNCPANISVTTLSATCDTPVSWTPPAVTDNCGAMPVVTTTHAPGATFTLGVHTVAYEATDAAGNKETCSFTVTVTDGTKPVFTDCPTDISVTTNPATCDAVVHWAPPAVTDNCDAAPVMIGTHSPGATFALGVHTVTYEATDAAGNKETCSFTVTVTDGTRPVFTNCPVNISVPAGAGSCNAIVNWTPPGVTDNCDPSPVVTSTGNPGATFTLGVHTVTYEATDAAGNKETCSFTVTVKDLTRPVFAGCPADMNVFTRTTACDAVVNWTPPTASDNCDASPTITITTTHIPGSTFAPGIHTVTYTATDTGGNTETCSFTITVTDDADPVFTACPTNIVVTADPSSCAATPSWTVPVASDNCTATPAVTGNFQPGDQFPAGTTTTVIYTAQDAAGNSATCSFTVTVNDNTAPVITGCPAGVNVTTDATCQAIATWTPPVATDNCLVTLTSTHTPGDAFPTGTTTVIYTATDDAGNVTTCSFDVIARDAVAPVFANCPGNITAAASDTECGASVRWTPPTASDNCAGIVNLSATHAPGDLFAVGTTIVTYTATDISGNRATCSFTITVNDDAAPKFLNCPGDIAVASDNACGAIVTWTPPSAIDNCSVVGITSTHQPGARFDTGITEVVYTATDIHGNASVCRFNIKVRNGEVPLIAGCPADVLAKAGESGEIAVTWEPPTASTRCGPLILMGSHQPGDIFPVGSTPVTYTAANDAGATVTCTFNVIVSYEDLDIEVTRVVTPDGDGKNDEWVIARIEKFNRNRVFILDRWGSVIYQASGYNNTTIAWNGVNSNGVQVPSGTYYYVIEVDFLEKHLKKSGFFELLR